MRLAEYQVEDVKARALATADQTGNAFFSIFLVFGTFSVLAGLLLIFLIFVMLAAERRGEMGMARAVGLHRRHLVQSFVVEGTVYDLAAASLGTLLGLGVSWVMVRVMADVFNQFSGTQYGLQLKFLLTPYSLVIAFCLGMLLTFLTVTFSSWRVSRLTIVAAIRDLPDTGQEATLMARIFRLMRAVVLIVIGVSTMSAGYATEQAAPVYTGISLIVVGCDLLVAWLLHRTRVPRPISDRIAFSAMGALLVSLWMLPYTWISALRVEGFAQGNASFILSGIFAVLGGVWLLVYNGGMLLWLLSVLTGWMGSLAPVARTATAYALMSKFRTGMTVAMFGLIIFILVIMTTLVTAQDFIYNDRAAITGGYDIVAIVSGENRIGDLEAAIATRPELDPAALEVVSAVSQFPIEVRQVGAKSQIWNPYFGSAAAPSYFQTVEGSYKLKHVPGFPDDASVWKALRERDDVVLLQRLNVTTQQGDQQTPPPRFEVEGAFIEDEVLPDWQLELRVPGTDRVRKVQVVGVLEGFLTLPLAGLYTNQATAQALPGSRSR